MNEINSFDETLSKKRCKEFRLRILDISQKVSALHLGASFSCMEMIDCVYFGFLEPTKDKLNKFVLSKGHGGIAQYVILEKLGVLSSEVVDLYCANEGILGCHPDYGVPGIEASTGSLGHGMALSTGIAHTSKNILKNNGTIFVILSDGEFQEGSTWEALMMAANLNLNNIVALLDHNGFQSFGRTSETHPSFYPINSKIEAFGWEVEEVDGHDSKMIFDKIINRKGNKPFMLICNTTKGKGISFIENVPIWHYRSPSPEEYILGVKEIKEN